MVLEKNGETREMKVVNKTQISDVVVKDIVRWLTKGITRRITTITISYTRKHGHRGHITYPLPWTRAIIRVAIARNGYPYPVNYWRSAHFNFPKYEVSDPLENLVATLAHEIGHLKKYIHHQRNTEQKAERYALKKLQKFRERREKAK